MTPGGRRRREHDAGVPVQRGGDRAAGEEPAHLVEVGVEAAERPVGTGADQVQRRAAGAAGELGAHGDRRRLAAVHLRRELHGRHPPRDGGLGEQEEQLRVPQRELDGPFGEVSRARSRPTPRRRRRTGGEAGVAAVLHAACCRGGSGSTAEQSLHGVRMRLA